MILYLVTNFFLIFILLLSIFLPAENDAIKSLLQAVAIMFAFNKDIILKYCAFAPKIKVSNSPIRYGNKCNINLIIRGKIQDQVEIANFTIFPSHIIIREFRIDGKIQNPDDKFLLTKDNTSANIYMVIKANSDRVPCWFEVRFMYDGNHGKKNLFLYKDVIIKWRGYGRKILQHFKL